MSTKTTTHHTIDATGKRLGRVATEIAVLLMGKNTPEVTRHLLAPVRVSVANARKLLVGEKKRIQTAYVRYTGYPDGLRTLSMAKLIERKGYAEVLRKAVYGMLPHNKLRAKRMKQLTVSE